MFKALSGTHVKCVECSYFEMEQKCKRNKLFPPAFYRSLCFMFRNSEPIKLGTPNWFLSIVPLMNSGKFHKAERLSTHSVCLAICLLPFKLVPF